MVFKCCVPNCRGNYSNGPKVHVFGFPKDEEKKRQWISAIHRENFQPSFHSKVCHVHFKTEDVVWETSYFDERNGKKITAPLDKPRLKEDAIPCILPGCPSYLSTTASTRESPDEKRIRLESEFIEKAVKQSLSTAKQYSAKYMFSDLNELLVCQKTNKLSSFWSVINNECSVVYANINIEGVPELVYSVVIDIDLKLSVFYKGVSLNNFGDNFKFPLVVKSINIINEVLLSIEKKSSSGKESQNSKHLFDVLNETLHSLSQCHDDDKEFFEFICSQIQLFENRQRLRYKPEDIVFFSLLHFVSPSAYKFLKESGKIIAPHPNTIQRVCSRLNVGPESETHETKFLGYIKRKIGLLKSCDLTVTVMVDEIHIKQYMDYKGGNVVGASFNCEKLASSAHVFMISSITSAFKDVVHILPVSSLNAQILHDILKKVIVGLEKIGFKVIAVITDNNAINRRVMSFFAAKPTNSFVYPHPSNHCRPLFYVVDTVHLLKCIRNNWINQKNSDKTFICPKFSTSSKGVLQASFNVLRKMYDLESHKLLKYGYGLSLKALWPSNLERQNVKPVIQIFNDYIVEAINILGLESNFKNYEDTAEFLKIITTWWKIVNVKMPQKGRRLNDIMQEPLTNSVDDYKFKFLQDFLLWLERWEEMRSSEGTLTRETLSALKLSTNSLIELANYCTEELGLTYVLPGKFQTDILENRFGKYRHLSGSQYHISVRQVYEAEHKLRLSSIMRISIKSQKSGIIPVHNFDVEPVWNVLSSCEFLIEKFSKMLPLPEADILAVEDDLPIITYLGGYCAYSVLKRLKCDSCKGLLVIDKLLNEEIASELIQKLDRGSLLYPQPIVTNAVTHAYVVVKHLVGPEFEGEFLKVENQRCVATTITMDSLIEGDFISWDCCTNNHSSEDVIKMVVWAATNTLLKNYCKKRVNAPENFKKSEKKRKLSTLTNLM